MGGVISGISTGLGNSLSSPLSVRSLWPSSPSTEEVDDAGSAPVPIPVLTQITTSFFIGNRLAALDLPLLQARHIQCLISLEVHSKPNLMVQQQCQQAGLAFYNVPVVDSNETNITGPEAAAPQITTFLDQHPQLRTLVYCDHQQSRSPSIAMYYLITHYHLTLGQTFGLVQQHSAVQIDPKPGFMTQLDQVADQIRTGVSSGGSGGSASGAVSPAESPTAQSTAR